MTSINIAYTKKLWTDYTETLLHEALLATQKFSPDAKGQEEMESLASKIDRKIRPVLPCALTPSRLFSLEQSRGQQLYALLFQRKPHPFQEASTQTQNYQNYGFTLSIYHYNLTQLSYKPLLHISKDLKELMEKVGALDQTRLNEFKNRFRAGWLGFIGLVSYVTGVFSKNPWMALVGKVFLAVASLLWTYNWILHRHDAPWIKSQYLVVGQKAAQICSYLCYYDEQMKCQLNPVSEFDNPLPGFMPLPVDTSTLEAADLQSVVYDNS